MHYAVQNTPITFTTDAHYAVKEEENTVEERKQYLHNLSNPICLDEVCNALLAPEGRLE